MTHIEKEIVTFDTTAKATDLIDAVMGDAPTVFACLDANRIVNLCELLEVAGVEHRCLFQGALEREAASAAPWIVRFNRDDKLLQQVLTSAGPKREDPFAFLEAEAGIFFHSDLSLADLRQHLRRFLRVQAGPEKFFLFRFWEPLIAQVYFSGLDDRPDVIARWFVGRSMAQISSIAVPLCSPAQTAIIRLTPADLPQQSTPPTGQFKLTNGDVARFRDARLTRDCATLAIRLRETFPKAENMHSATSLDDFVSASVARMMQFGFAKKAHLFTLLAWDLHYGPQFELRDPQGYLAQILATAGPEKERLAQLKARMSQIG